MRGAGLRKAGYIMDDLVRSIRTKEIVSKYGFRFNKGLGQNFLVDGNILGKIVEAAEINRDSSVLEVGPGIGTLTLELAENAGRVLAIELDDNLIPILNEVFKDYGNITLHHGDAMKLDLKPLAEEYLKSPITICANIPYYITTPLINKFFKEGLSINNIVLMVQKEVAERMAAEPGGKEYGSLSLLVQYYSQPSIITAVPPQCFMPSPKVESVVIKLKMHERPPVELEDEDLFFRVIRESFNQRRKTLLNSLKGIGLPKELLIQGFERLGIDPVRRGETLSIQEFASLSNELHRLF